MAEIRERLMRGIAIDMAFEGDSAETLCIGPPEGDCDEEYHLLYFASRLGTTEGVGSSEERARHLEEMRKITKERFQRFAMEHHETTLTKTELNWLMRKAGAIVTEEGGSGIVDVDFYGNSVELDRAWQEYTMDVAQSNEEEYHTEWMRHRVAMTTTSIGQVNVAPHFKIRRD